MIIITYRLRIVTEYFRGLPFQWWSVKTRTEVLLNSFRVQILKLFDFWFV